MIDDCNDQKIVLNGFGEISLYDATLENAQAILNSVMSDVSSNVLEAVALQEDKTKYVCPTENVTRVFKELLTSENGQELPAYSRFLHGKDSDKPVVVMDTDLRNKLIAWYMTTGKPLDQIGQMKESEFMRNIAQLDTSTLFIFDGLRERAKDRTICFLESYLIEQAEELVVLRRNQWKDTAKLSRVIYRFLEFSNQYTHRDVRYSMSTCEATF